MKKQLNLAFKKLKKKKGKCAWEHLLAASFSEGTRRKQKTGSLSLWVVQY